MKKALLCGIVLSGFLSASSTASELTNREVSINKKPVISSSFPKSLNVYFKEGVPFYIPLKLKYYITDPMEDMAR